MVTRKSQTETLKAKINKFDAELEKIKDQKTIDKIRVEIAVMKLCNCEQIVNYYFTYYYK